MQWYYVVPVGGLLLFLAWELMRPRPLAGLSFRVEATVSTFHDSRFPEGATEYESSLRDVFEKALRQELRNAGAEIIQEASLVLTIWIQHHWAYQHIGGIGDAEWWDAVIKISRNGVEETRFRICQDTSPKGFATEVRESLIRQIQKAPALTRGTT